jgi:MFS family permease
MAMNMQMITRGWLVLELANDSPLAQALVMMSFAVPMTFVSLIGGALADRIPRRRMIIFSQNGNAATNVLLAVLDMTGLVAFWQVLALGVVNGSLMAFNMPSRQAIISEAVPENKLMNAISINNSGMNLTRIAGPALAGVLIIFIDTAGVFYLVGAIYVFSSLSMLMVKAGNKPANRARKSMVVDIREGLGYVRSDATLMSLVMMALFASLFGFSYWALLPSWGREALDIGPDGLGILLTIMGVGALVGTLGLAAMRGFNKKGALLLGSCVAWGASLALFSQTTSYATAIPFLLFIGLVSSAFMSLNMTLLQIHADPQMRGRVMSINMMTFGLMPLSGVPFGILAEIIGTPNALMWSGVGLTLAMLAFALKYPSFRKIA